MNRLFLLSIFLFLFLIETNAQNAKYAAPTLKVLTTEGQTYTTVINLDLLKGYSINDFKEEFGPYRKGGIEAIIEEKSCLKIIYNYKLDLKYIKKILSKYQINYKIIIKTDSHLEAQ